MIVKYQERQNHNENSYYVAQKEKKDKTNFLKFYLNIIMLTVCFQFWNSENRK